MNNSAQITSAGKILFTMAAIVVVLAGVQAASVVVVPVLLALFIAIICHPLIEWFHRQGLPRFLALLPVVGVIAIIVLLLTGLVVQSVNEFTQKLPEYRDRSAAQFEWLVAQAESYNISLNWELLQSQLDPSRAINLTVNMLSGVGNFMASFVIVLLIMVFMIGEARIVPAKIRLAIKHPERTMGNVGAILHAINKYLALKTLISLFTGVLIGFSLWLMNIDHYLLWGVVAFLFNYIPNIGSILASVPAIIMALIQYNPWIAGAVALLYLAVNVIMGNIIEPRVMGRGLGLSTLVVFLSLLFWGWMLGPVGMLLSVPLTMVVKIALMESDSTRWLAIALAGDEILRMADNEEGSGAAGLENTHVMAEPAETKRQ
ncbi:AI-2E family transporter [Aliidiomarina soli]|nr:AI-2E family transporter [Aliidiomarina soli]